MRYESSWETDPDGWVDAALKEFGLDLPSRKASTAGHRAVNTLAENIHDRASRFEGPDGPWKENAESTIERKGFNAPNVETAEMLSPEQIRGEVAVSRHEARMTYGKDAENRAKAHYAHEGQSHLKVKRPFMGVTESDADQVADGFADDLASHLMKG